MPDPVTSRSSAATKRPAAGPLRNSALSQPLKTKAEKRAEAKANKARAQARQKRNQTLTVVGSAVVVLALVVGLIAWISNTSSNSTVAPAAASAEAAAAPTATEPAATEPAAAFPPVPDGADPALSTKPAATKGSGTLSKLTTKTLIEGKGAAVESGQTINVNYVGVTYADGKEFDSSWSRSEAFSFQIGSGGVIQGWDQGLIGVKVGSRVQLDIPADLAYGDNPTGGQPAGALRFIVDVLSAS
ncbi:peptidylprolyl isomerase [Actinoplanes lutulentus]|uniref:FKBP-type peptidyl-prolyl cis-trans isomerase n=1 Tax=Actinoplanes lutulentus TaxID=1287878 RepID=UPI000DB917D0|nr:FKBP-type peptidyl-prolyl cis-trans isomerase [Actinoplanes lutulentus]MBB2946985.1 peptidylprolyl isomerase [Actinoplanes lutulentus]